MLNNLIFIKASYYKTIKMRAEKDFKNKLDLDVDYILSICQENVLGESYWIIENIKACKLTLSITSVTSSSATSDEYHSIWCFFFTLHIHSSESQLCSLTQKPGSSFFGLPSLAHPLASNKTTIHSLLLHT